MSKRVTIPEIKGNFYGGYPYTVDLQIGSFETASTLTIKVVNETGIYSTPALSWENMVSIVMGSLTFNGYLVEYKNVRGVTQKELELIYVDCSNLLDKYYIGLHKRHGINPNAPKFSNSMNYKGYVDDYAGKISDYLIIVGHEIHPCDINKDGIIDDADFVAQIDYCDPCPTCPPDKQIHKCKTLPDLVIMDVGYSFDELCSRIGIKPPNIKNITSIVRSYSGTLRDVLQAWCNEFALSFYWKFSASTLSDGLVLFDRSIPITANTVIDECTVTELSTGGSIKNNFASSIVSYYKRDGNKTSYPCTNSEFYTLQCIRLRDLFNPSNYQELDTKIRWNELAVSLSYYDSALRDCLWWFNYYGIVNAAKAKEFVLTEAETKNRLIMARKAGKVLTPFGNMVIRQVISVNDPHFYDLSLQMGKELDAWTARSKDLGRDATNPSYYFIVAKYDENLLNSQAEHDVDLARNFIGKHWIKLTNGPGCGSGGYNNLRYGHVNVDDPEKGADWYSATGESIFVDFAKFGHEAKSKIDDFLTVNNIDKSNAPTKKITKSLGNGITVEEEAKQSFIYKQRPSPSWYPNQSEMSNYSDMLAYYKRLCFGLLDRGKKGRDQQLLSRINPEYVNQPDIALFIVQELKEGETGLPITISDTKNFLEPDKLKTIYGHPEDLGGCISYGESNGQNNQIGPVLGSYGLLDNQCSWVTFDGFSFMTPVQGTELSKAITESSFDPQTDLAPFPSAGYKVRATCEMHIPVCIPKIQQSVVDVSPDVAAAAKQELTFLDISDDDIKIFGGGTCVPSKDAIMALHKAKSAGVAKSKIGVEKTAEYQMVGVAPEGIPSLGEGLDSVKIVVGDNGVFTNFTISDKISKPLSQEVIMMQLLHARDMNASSHPAVGNYVAQTAGNLKIPNG